MGHKGKFKQLDENITGLVKSGDGSTMQNMGKGTILFQCKNSDQRLLTKACYIPSLCSNIIILSQIAEDGSEIVMANRFLKIYDRNGALLMKVRRTANRLYKIHLETCRPFVS